MTDRTFVDTNVWVYAADEADPVRQARAREVLSPSNGTSMVLSAQVLGEFYVTVTRKLARPATEADAGRMVDQMRQLPVVDIDGSRVAAAIDGSRRWQLSYWDALIVVAAQAAGCTRLLTEDLGAGTSYGGVRIENPFATPRRMAEESARYAATSGVWSDADLSEELARYEEEARATGMRPNAVHSYWDYARRFLAWRTGEYRPRGASTSGRPVPTGAVSADELERQAAAYGRAIEAAGREQATIDTYHRHAMFFVRWLRREFAPGARLG